MLTKVIGWSDKTLFMVDCVFDRCTCRTLMMVSNLPESARIQMVLKNPTKVMVWAMVLSDNAKMPLIIFPAGQDVNTTTYRELMLEPMMAWVCQRYMSGTFVLMQNGAPAHTAQISNICTKKCRVLV